MAVSGIGNTAASAAAPASGGSEVSREEFLNLLVAELTNQNPLEPMDNSQFLTQLTQLESLQSTNALSESIQTMLRSQQVSTAGSMLGQTISGFTDDNFRVHGSVTSVTLAGNEVRVVIAEPFTIAFDADGNEEQVPVEQALAIKLENVMDILSPAAAPKTEEDPDPDGGPV